MAQFSVHVNPNAATSQSTPYLLNVQSDVLDGLSTRVVVPLIRESLINKPATYFNPRFEIAGERVVMSTAELAGILLRDLGTEITNLGGQRSEIIAALDFLFTGV